MNPRFTVSILTYTELTRAKACIASVLQSTVPCKMILTANGNPEAALYFGQLAADFPGITVVGNAKNDGFIAPNNHALTLCDTEFFVCLNDDTIVPDNWLEKMAAIMDANPKVAIVGPHGGCCSLDEKFVGYRGKQLEYIEGSCLMVRTDLAKTFGLFSGYLDFANCEDADLSLRFREMGYTIKQAKFTIYHAIGATRPKVKGLAEIFQKNLATCQVRWHTYLRWKHRTFPHEQ